ncbi:aminotransferase [Nibricoccus aquaticus]|uniref:Aminotransferase n=1 Tax=Nibricoccus aquaticus TaxID=2576891 RepID=A0A290QEQ2_9BACT|nr:aminotransferase class I/II-fold pyridoxal phosphate-dependent enzyme [Nibricoccus aquaticus]ATC64746.1 aminotransferase [Nibricoccus aquaticus]
MKPHSETSLRNRLKRLGGPGLFSVPISTSNLYTPEKRSVLRYLEEGFEKQSDQEPALCAQLADRLRRYHDSEYCVLFSTGFWALVSAIKLKALPGKSEVIIPSLTYRRLADVVFWAGLTPVLVDIDPADLSISPQAIDRNIGAETGLILAVHPIVNCCDVSGILALSKRRGVPVVFDAVESAHETVSGKRIGSFGVGEVFSLHASKLINGLEGGYVCTNDAAFAASLKIFRTGAVVTFPDESHYGLNGLPHPGHAAFALAALDELNKNIDHNRTIYRAYQKQLASLNGIRLLKFDEQEQTSYKNIVVEVQDNFPINRDALCNAMNSESILARKHYSPPLHQKTYSYSVAIREMQQTELAEARYLNLPCGSRVTPQDVSTVCDFIAFAASEPEFFTSPAK